MQKKDDTKSRILRAALKVFAHNGYGAGSIQEIVKTAKVTKPALYYYFGSKEGLHSALVELAQDTRYEVMVQAVEKPRNYTDKLAALIDALLNFATEHREFARVCFATAFAAPGEVPNQQVCLEKSQRNFQFVHGLIEQGIKAGEFDDGFDAEELTMAIYSQILVYIISQAIPSKSPLRRPNAHRMVNLFFDGARSKKKGRG